MRERPSPDRVAYWNRYFSTHEEGPLELLETLVLLKTSNKIQDVEAAIRGYLQHRPDRRAWMYAMLAVALDNNLASEDSIKNALGYAAVQAIRPEPEGDAEVLVSIIDLMAARKWLELEIPDGKDKTRTLRVGDLLDDAAKRIPHRPEPLIRSLSLAEMTMDPERMAKTAEGLLSLGWPGVDAQWRKETRQRVEALANRLREDGRTKEAEALMGRLDAAEPRDVFARLSWEGSNAVDLDLLIEEPLGATASFDMPRTVFGGSIVQNGRGREPEEIYTCPRGFSGVYTFTVKAVVNDPDDPVESAKLEVITHEGGENEKVQTFEVRPDAAEPIRVALEGGRRTEVLPFIVPKALAVEPRLRLRPEPKAGAPAAKPPVRP